MEIIPIIPLRIICVKKYKYKIVKTLDSIQNKVTCCEVPECSLPYRKMAEADPSSSTTDAAIKIPITVKVL